MNRRSVLASGMALASVTAIGAAVGEHGGANADTAPRSPSPSEAMTVDRQRLLPDTPQETAYFEIDSGTDGPTGFVLGGVHGDEVNGYRAAEDIVGWELERGSLVVVPWANKIAVERNTRHGPDGDLNRKFPADAEPETDLARAIWELLREYDPAVVLDLHRSRGIYRTHNKWVGQTIFPTAVDSAPADAESAIAYINGVIPRTMWFHRFTKGGRLDGANPMVVHKAGADLDTPGFIVELTDFLIDLDTQVRWTKLIAEQLLARYGLERRSPESDR